MDLGEFWEKLSRRLVGPLVEARLDVLERRAVEGAPIDDGRLGVAPKFVFKGDRPIGGGLWSEGPADKASAMLGPEPIIT